MENTARNPAHEQSCLYTVAGKSRPGSVAKALSVLTCSDFREKMTQICLPPTPSKPQNNKPGEKSEASPYTISSVRKKC
jgi:hypothetical protein